MFQTFQLRHLRLELLELTGCPMFQMVQPKPAPVELLELLELQNPLHGGRPSVVEVEI